MANQTKVRSASELYEYADHLRWAAGDLHECYQKMKAHTADFAQQWQDQSAMTFMQLLEREEHVIQELMNEFTRYEEAVRKRADYVQEYVSIGKRYRL